MAFFSDATIAQLKTLQNSGMPDTAIIRRTAQVSDWAGGSTEAVTWFIGLPCRVEVTPLQRGELLIGGQLAGGLPWPITFKHDADVRLSDRINVNGELDDVTLVGGRNFDVLAIYGPTSYMSRLRCICAER